MQKNVLELKKNQLEILSIAEGFFQSSVLFALLKLRIFEIIGEEYKTLNEIAGVVDTRPETIARLLNAGVVLKLLQSDDGVTYQVAPSCRSVLLPSAGDNYLGNWLRNLDYFRSALSKLDEAVFQSGPVVNPSTHLGNDKNQTREYILAMHNYASLRGKELARFLNTDKCNTFLDLGCGPGTYAYNIGLRNADLTLTLLDFPDVLDIAKEVKEKYPLTNKIEFLPLDAVRDEIPGSYDIILVSNMLHMLGEESCCDLIKRLYKCVNVGGSLVIQAQYLNDDLLGKRWPILLDLIQLCTTEQGRNHTFKETRQWLKGAGFRNIEFCEMTLLNTNSYLRGYKTNGNELLSSSH